MNTLQARYAKVQRLAEEQSIPVRNIELLNIALTHTSYANEHKSEHIHDNERLEFLGDAVLDLVIGEYLFLRYPDWAEGDLTRARASVVCERSLAECANRFNLGEYLRLGKGEDQSGGRSRASLLADAFEAMIGAIYLDNSYDEAAQFILAHLQADLEKIHSGQYSRDYKTELQEWLQRDGDADIFYQLEREEGPDHDKVFYMSVLLDGQLVGKGSGKSKKDAAQQAAKEALQHLKRS